MSLRRLLSLFAALLRFFLTSLSAIRNHAGKLASDGWVFFTTYNTEQAYTNLEQNDEADRELEAVGTLHAQPSSAHGEPK